MPEAFNEEDLQATWDKFTTEQRFMFFEIAVFTEEKMVAWEKSCGVQRTPKWQALVDYARRFKN